MKRKKMFQMLGVVIILALLTGGCSAKKEDSANMSFDTASTSSADYDVNMDGAEYESMETTTDAKAPTADEESGSSALKSKANVTSGNAVVQSQDKIIRTFYMDVEIQEFDSLITKINSEIKRLSGYVENSNISGKGYNNDGGTRYGNIIARIPTDKVDEFVGTVNKDGNVINQKESTENVSLQYIEAESRIETLKIEQERLFAILEKEISLENIIILENRLSDIRYELQNYETQIRFYDNKVAYSTVTLSIQEVIKFTPVTEIKQTVGTRIQNGLSDTLYNLSEGFKNFLVWFIVNLPYLFIWGVIILVVVLIIRKSLKKSKARKTSSRSSLMDYIHQNNDEQSDKHTD